jgi:glutathione S-transferase
MKFYSAPLSLYTRKVEIALHEKQIKFERVRVPFTQETGYQLKNWSKEARVCWSSR